MSQRLDAQGRRVDRNGIPILDSPKEANALPKFCPDGFHRWHTVNQEREYDYIFGTVTTIEKLRCLVCSIETTEERTER